MDVCGSLRKQSPTETPRPPSVLAEKNNALNSVSSRRPRIREVSSRYKSPSQSMASSTRRCPSPNLTRTIPSHTQLGSKRALSAERKRPSRPPSPPSPSTPVHESSVDSTQLSSRKLSGGGGGGGRLPESLWPSTMRSLSVSFQSDTISIPVSKKEKPVTNIALDRTLRPPLNVAHKHGEMHSALSRKPTPERKRSTLKGKNAPVQSENSKPVDSIQTRLIDQQRWPSRIGEQVSANSLAKSVDPVDDTVRNSGTSGQGIGIPSLRRSSLDSLTRPLQKSSSDATSRLLTFDEISRVGSVPKPVDDSSLRVTGPCKLTSLGLSERSTSATAAVKSQSLPSSRSQPASLSRTSVLSSARGVSPSRARPSTPPRGISPSRIRSSTTSQSSSSASVLSFIADFKRGKKSTNYIDDAHHLRLLYNRYLQWRFINARAETALYVQKIVAEETFYNVWDTTLNLWDSVISKRINLQQLNLDLKLNAVLNDQMAYLDDWASIERDHIGSLAGVVEDLEASTCRVPITGGARADIESLKAAVCSAVDLMESMGSSECSLPSRLEGMNSLVSELLVVAEQGKAMLAECEALLASTAAMQVGEYSLRTHLLQQKQALEKGY
ncbi:AUGMIN subunit 8-like [Mangifera indica]|uniref:AUGMIN subunit 8-like n=1 Tax=Mangifera indica TaxID=29780 RepID=UPI001CF9A821|nr:AUGMIN subunit 8-like [Mangifera indica]